MPGALILKNYKLIGVHIGAVPVKPGQSPSERQLYQMMWIGALFDMGTKKLRAGAEVSERADSEPAASTSGTNLGSLRGRESSDQKTSTSEKIQTYVCPSCFTSNACAGNCFNCGALIEEKLVQPKRQGFFSTTLRIRAISDLQEKYTISDKQVFAIIGGSMAAIIVLISMITVGNSVSIAPSNVPVNSAENKNIEQVIQLAVNVVGFKGIAPPGYSFADSAAETSPLPSFVMFSEANNQKILFVIFNDMSPVLALDRFTQIPPFSDIVATKDPGREEFKVTEGSQILGDGNFHYFVRGYPTAINTIKTMLVGSFPAKEAGKSVLVLGQALKEGTYDYKSTLFLIDTMAESRTTTANSKLLESVLPENKAKKNEAQIVSEKGSNGQQAKEAENKIASQEEIDQYCQDLQVKLQKKVDAESDLQEEVKRRKFGKLKVVLEFDIDANGNLQKLEITEPDTRQKTNDDLVKAIGSCGPYANVPKTDDGSLSLRLVFSKNGSVKITTRD
jgi:hypothetical protein